MLFYLLLLKNSLFSSSFYIKNIPTSFEYHIYLKENIYALKTNNIELLKHLNPNNIPLEQIKKNLIDLLYSEAKEKLFFENDIVLHKKVQAFLESETDSNFIAKVEIKLPENANFLHYYNEGIADCIDFKQHIQEATSHHFCKVMNLNTHQFEFQHFTIRPCSYLDACEIVSNRTFNNQDKLQYVSKNSLIVPKSVVSDIKKIDYYIEDLNLDVVQLALNNRSNLLRINEKSVFNFYNNGFRESSIMFQVKETVKKNSTLIDSTVDLKNIAETLLS